jgi:DNA polymerase (family 10)
MKKPSNKHIAQILYEIADILEMKDVEFKPRAYSRAAREVEEYPKTIADIKEEKELEKIPGVGKSIAEKIKEISETGTSEYYEQLKRSIPVDITTLNRIEGIGPKTIKKLYDELGIRSLKDLEKAVRGKKLQKLEGFREKTEQNILKGIASFRRHAERYRLDEALFYTDQVLEAMKAHPDTIKIEIAGSIRRWQETIGDADILIASKNADKSIEYFTSLEHIDRVIAKGSKKATVEFENGFQADLRVIDEKSWGAALQYFTGDKAHNIKIRSLAIRRGYKLNEYGLFTKKGTQIASKTERDIYTKLHLQTPPPEIRTDKGEIEAALEHSLPKLIELTDIKGDLQAHTTYSDGLNSSKEMADAAFKQGLSYLAITDHNTEGLEVAGGVEVKDIPSYIKKLKSTKSKCHILASLEINIAKDGSITVPDKILKQLDFVLIAVHSHFRLGKNEMTKRILKAFENPYVHAFAHPLGRLLLKRDAYEIDFEAVCKKAKEKNILLEINAHPERLDLDGDYIKKAKEYGCTFSIGTDSHSTKNLLNIRYGVHMARRGWLTRSDVINTYTFSKLKKFLSRKK